MPDEMKVTYYPIDEEAARLANSANSMFEYKPGAATELYRNSVDKAVEIAKRQKARVDPIHHDKIDRLVDLYARKLAENINQGYRIDGRVPSILVAGPVIPARAKEKQNNARDKNSKEWAEIQGLLDKIRSTGMGGISADDPEAVQKLEAKLANLISAQNLMKEVNAYYRKHQSLDGCPLLPEEEIGKLKASMNWGWRTDRKPFETWALSNNSAEIRRVKDRIVDLKRRSEQSFQVWRFQGGRVEVNSGANRLQIFFNNIPEAGIRTQLKSSGFKWSPKAGARQRQLTKNAVYAAKHMECLKPQPEQFEEGKNTTDEGSF